MKITDFRIGLEFMASAGFLWRCTDVGQRTILAIMLDPNKDPSWFNGPPYAVAEIPFDEYDFPACHLTEEEGILHSIDEADTSGHPGFPHEHVVAMMKARIKALSQQMSAKHLYPNKSVLRLDRMDSNGEIYHPYAADMDGDHWNVLTYRPFLQDFKEMPESEFVLMTVASKEDVKKRSLRHIRQ